MDEPPAWIRSTYQATHDALTGLINRREFERRIEEALACMPVGARHTLCYLDLDRFKTVNDEAGTHLAGDTLLREIATVLRQAVGISNTVARIGGDEFGVLLRNWPLERGRQMVEDLVRAVSAHRFVWKEKVFGVGVSVGLVEVIGEGGLSMEDLMMAAEVACISAKDQGGGRVQVRAAESFSADARNDVRWLQLLQSALRDNRFELHAGSILPVGEGADPTLPGLEVRLTLRDFSGARVPPSAFVHAAERLELMPRVERWVVETSISALARGAVRLSPDSSMCISISGATLGEQGFAEFVIQSLEANNVAPGRVCFEISSTTIARRAADTRRFMGVLYGNGCRFALRCEGENWREIPEVRDFPFEFVRMGDGAIRRI